MFLWARFRRNPAEKYNVLFFGNRFCATFLDSFLVLFFVGLTEGFAVDRAIIFMSAIKKQ
jgi:hypothetical protein